MKRRAAGAGALFFAFHMGVSDLLCALFSLLAPLAWTHRRRVVSFAAFWLASKSKELAVMLPAAPARTIPFYAPRIFLVSAPPGGGSSQ